MRVAQYKILKNVLEKITVPDYVHAFEIGKNIPEMAALHVGKKIVVSLDLKDFFTSIKQFHLVQLFEHIGFAKPPALTLAELCTYKSFVPQGALTSPKVSNIITALTFGPLIKQYCDAKGYTLSIYADDITVSCESNMDGLEGRGTVAELLQLVKTSIGKYGFKLNKDKIKVMYNSQRQWVCGAVVNEKVNMRKTERNTLRAIVYNVQKNGLEQEATKVNLTASQFHSKIAGRINWFAQLNPAAGNIMKDKFKEVTLDQIMCPSAETENVKETGPLDSQLPVIIQTETELPSVASVTVLPW